MGTEGNQVSEHLCDKYTDNYCLYYQDIVFH